MPRSKRLRALWLGWLSVCLLSASVLTSCHESRQEAVARVGKEVLTLPEVLIQMPLGADSATFVEEYVARWEEEQLVYQAGLHNVQDLDLINREVEEYRRRLVSESYVQQVISSREHPVSDEECQTFYDQHAREMKLSQPIVKAVCVKVLKNSSMVTQLRKWLEEILAGNTDHVEELEQYCERRAVYYDNFIGRWSDLRQLTDVLPVTVVEPASFLKVGVFQLKDDDYVYLAAIADYRLAGEVQPLDYAQAEIREMLAQQHRQQAYQELLRDLKASHE